jgi:gag-polypeptide of LTR copia-type
MVEKILRSLTDTFENMIYAIEESDNLTELSVDELVGSLLAHEQRKKTQEERISPGDPSSKGGSRREGTVCAEGITCMRPRR